MASLPTTMRAVDVLSPGGTEQLTINQVYLPKVGSGQVLIKVAACGVNRPDVLQRKGLYPPPGSADPRLGLEVSGEVVALGNRVHGSMLGAQVMALCNGGGYAEYVSVPASQCMAIPFGVSLQEAASLPETYLTVWQNLFHNGSLTSGMHVLIHGGSSGIGSAAIQLAAAHGATVHVTVGSEEKKRYCQSLGATYAYNYKEQEWEKEVLANHSPGVDLILDMVAASYINRNLKCIAIKGKILVIALLGGRQIEFDGAKLLLKQATVLGSTLRPQSLECKAKLSKAVEASLGQLFKQGRLRTTVSKRYKLSEVRLAHDFIESGELVGKIILEI